MAAIAPDSGVRLYTEANYSGTELVFAPGEPYSVALDTAYKDQISSLRIPTGTKVILTDQEGNCSYSRSFGPGDHANVGESIDNKADIVVVTVD